MSLPLTFALLAAVLFAAGALLIKRATELGVGVWRAAFVANLATALVFQPLWALGGTVHPGWWWQPVLAAACFLGGQWLTFLAFATGDVSVATPVMGIKLILVAALATWWAGESLRAEIWVAALLAMVGVGLLNRSGAGQPHRRVGRTILFAALAATAYAAFDVLTQLWAPRWGIGRFLPLTLGLAGVLSFLYLAKFRAPLGALPRATWRWLLAGAGVMALQAFTITGTIAAWGGVATVNVAYSSRGLWSVLLVGLLGRWVGSREGELGPVVLRWRLAGAVLMLAAIGLLVW